jgi:hypothetical protein
MRDRAHCACLLTVELGYGDPLHDGLPVKDLIAFYNERVDIEVDGEPQERPRTEWSVH